MKRIVPILVGVVALLFCAAVWAQDAGPVLSDAGSALSDAGPSGGPVVTPDTGGDTTALTQLTKIAFEILTLIIGIFATWGAHRLIKVFETKTGVDIPDKQEAQIDKWIEQGIYLAAEKSYQKIKEKTEKLKGPEKLEVGADFVFDLAISRGWTEWTKDKIKNKMEVALGVHRAHGGVPKLEDKVEG